MARPKKTAVEAAVEDQLFHRETNVGRREASAQQREDSLNKREAALNTREENLRVRENAIKAQEEDMKLGAAMKLVQKFENDGQQRPDYGFKWPFYR